MSYVDSLHLKRHIKGTTFAALQHCDKHCKRCFVECWLCGVNIMTIGLMVVFYFWNWGYSSFYISNQSTWYSVSVSTCLCAYMCKPPCCSLIVLFSHLWHIIRQSELHLSPRTVDLCFASASRKLWICLLCPYYGIRPITPPQAPTPGTVTPQDSHPHRQLPPFLQL